MTSGPLNNARPFAKDFSIFLKVIVLPDPVENIPQLFASSGTRVDVGMGNIGAVLIRSDVFDPALFLTSLHPLVDDTMCFFPDAEII